jgi:hypothetical protein
MRSVTTCTTDLSQTPRSWIERGHANLIYYSQVDKASAFSGIDSICEQCHLPCMRDATTLAGWVVQLTISAHTTPTRADGTPWIGPAILSAPSFQYFNVAITDPEKAMEATRKHSGSDSGVIIGVVRSLSAAEIAAIPLSEGEVRRA